MKIGIDIDDTTFLTVKSMLKYADKFEEEISGVPINRDSFGMIKNRYIKLKDEGDTIHFVTARLMNIKNCDTEEITKKSLKNFGIPYDSLNLHVSDKLKFFKENKIDLCIEDSYETCRELTDNGIKSILMTTKMNTDINDKEIVRVNNWNEIYDEVEKYKNNL